MLFHSGTFIKLFICTNFSGKSHLQEITVLPDSSKNTAKNFFILTSNARSNACHQFLICSSIMKKFHNLWSSSGVNFPTAKQKNSFTSDSKILDCARITKRIYVINDDKNVVKVVNSCKQLSKNSMLFL